MISDNRISDHRISENSEFILIVDDTPTNLEVVSEALSDAGFETAVATSGERALKQIERRLPDLILLDIMMPGIDGFELCKRLKTNQLHCEIPIIFMTALADINSKVKGFDLGAVDYITKPFQELEVLARVGTHLKLKKTQQKLYDSEIRLEKVLNSLDEIVWSASLAPFQLRHIGSDVTKVCGYTANELIAESSLWLNHIVPSNHANIQACLTHPKKSERLTFEYQVEKACGTLCWLQSKIHIYYCPHNQQYMADGILHDISDRKQAEVQLHYTATHDELTGLVNRTYFIQTVNQVLKKQALKNQTLKKRAANHFAILFVDLDRFKAVNDSLGHQRGDQVLTQIAEVLHCSVRPGDVVARLGGDEFTILLQNLSDEDEAQLIVQRLQTKIECPITLEGGLTLSMSASIGVVMGSSTYASAHELLRDADIAMYHAKKLGKACHQIFSQELYEATLARITLEQDLRVATQNGIVQASTISEKFIQSNTSSKNLSSVQQYLQGKALNEPQAAKSGLFLMYQPIHQVDNQKLSGFEALLRWRHPEKGLLSPTEFIPIAEETGLIVPLGAQILREALMQLQHWQQRYPDGEKLTMSVNLSIRQLQEPDFLTMVRSLLQTLRVEPSTIKLEITESLLMQGGESGFETLNQLRDLGVSLSLDDFGTGYSSLSYLHRFPINTLKIDRSFIQKLEFGGSGFKIVRSIVELAHSLGMDVIAEGVETKQQLYHLQQLSCEMVQGYLLSPPISASLAAHHIQSTWSTPNLAPAQTTPST
ncbi:MAG: EAL domain-containing protein [Phormidesmis sp.]